MPVYNEELVIEDNIKKIAKYFKNNFSNWQIAIADNASSDKTGQISKRLESEVKNLKYFFIRERGRGGALKKTFLQFDADFYIYMDIDLAVDLNCVAGLIEAANNGYDMAIGSRFLKESRVQRSLKREISSRIYKTLARLILKTNISDFQCGFKLISKKVRDQVLPLCIDTGFFWDTEIICLTEAMGYKTKEIPVDWSDYRNEKRKSTVNVLATAIDYLKKIRELRNRASKLSKKQK